MQGASLLDWHAFTLLYGLGVCTHVERVLGNVQGSHNRRKRRFAHYFLRLGQYMPILNIWVLLVWYWSNWWCFSEKVHPSIIVHHLSSSLCRCWNNGPEDRSGRDGEPTGPLLCSICLNWSRAKRGLPLFYRYGRRLEQAEYSGHYHGLLVNLQQHWQYSRSITCIIYP